MASKDIKPYADLNHIASLHGGPQKYIQDIEKNSFNKGQLKGRLQGRIEGVVGLLFLEGIGCVGKTIWDKRQSKKKEVKKLEENAKIAKEKLMENEEKNYVDEERA